MLKQFLMSLYLNFTRIRHNFPPVQTISYEFIFLILPGFGIISHIICHKREKNEALGNLGIISASGMRL